MRPRFGEREGDWVGLSRFRAWIGALAPVCFASSAALAWITLDSPWPRWDAIVLFVVGAVCVATWFWLARRVPGVDRQRPSTGGHIRGRRIITACLYVGVIAMVAIGAGVAHDSPEWRAFAAVNPDVYAVDVVEVNDVTVIYHRRRPPTYRYAVTANIGTAGGQLTVTENRVETKIDPRNYELPGVPLVAFYDPEQPAAGVYFSDDPTKLSIIRDEPIPRLVSIAFPLILASIVYLWEVRKPLGFRSHPPATHTRGRSRRWKLVTSMWLAVGFTMWAVVLFGGDQGEVARFGNDVRDDIVLRALDTILFVVPFVVVGGVRLRAWAEDLQALTTSTDDNGSVPDPTFRDGGQPSSSAFGQDWKHPTDACGVATTSNRGAQRARRANHHQLRNREPTIWALATIVAIAVAMASRDAFSDAVINLCDGNPCPPEGMAAAGWAVTATPIPALIFIYLRVGNTAIYQRAVMVMVVVFGATLGLVFRGRPVDTLDVLRSSDPALQMLVLGGLLGFAGALVGATVWVVARSAGRSVTDPTRALTIFVCAQAAALITAVTIAATT